MSGGWEVNIEIDYSMVPTNVMDCIYAIDDGAIYKFVAYLGSQLVRGYNHAVVAEQIYEDTKVKNVVLIECYEDLDEICTVSSIDNLITGGKNNNEVVVEVGDDINDEAKNSFDDTFDVTTNNYTIAAVALLGYRRINGVIMERYYLVEATPLTDNDDPKSVSIISIIDSENVFYEVSKII